jgi:hypothetical protein
LDFGPTLNRHELSSAVLRGWTRLKSVSPGPVPTTGKEVAETEIAIPGQAAAIAIAEEVGPNVPGWKID